LVNVHACASSNLPLRQHVDGFKSSNGSSTEIVTEDSIADPSVVVLVNNSEPLVDQFLTGLHLDECECIFDGGSELSPAHDELGSFFVDFESVATLDGHFSEEASSAEVDEFVIGDLPVQVAVIKEDVLRDVVQLILVLLEQTQ
jgi:hypothetical protein